MQRDGGSIEQARGYARKLVDLAPENAGYRQLWVDLERLKNER